MRITPLLMGGALLAVSTMVGGFSCAFSRSGEHLGQEFETVEFFKTYMPGMTPYAEASIILQGTEIRCKVQREQTADDIKFSFLSHGQMIEDEVYRQTDEGFFLVRAAGESYEPPIMLAPRIIQNSKPLTWTGKAVFDPIEHSAIAKVTRASDSINLPSHNYEALKINVELSYTNLEQADTAVRNLSFWFVKDKGLFQRQFGSSSTRQPTLREQ